MSSFLNSFTLGVPVLPAEKLLSLDFKNGIYFRDGVTDTLVNTGVFVGTGATITGGVGATFTGAGYLGLQYDVTGDSFVIVMDTDMVAAGEVGRTLLDWGSNGNPRAQVFNTSGGQVFTEIGNGSNSTSRGLHNDVASDDPVKVAFGVRAGRLVAACVNGGAVLDVGTSLSPFTLAAGGGMAIGGIGSGTSWTKPLRSMQVWRVYSNAQIQALTA